LENSNNQEGNDMSESNGTLIITAKAKTMNLAIPWDVIIAIMNAEHKIDKCKCGDFFIVKRKGAIYCSSRCASRFIMREKRKDPNYKEWGRS
jgi:hypothetical protein